MGFFDELGEFVSDPFGYIGDAIDDFVDWFIDIPETPKYDDANKGTLLNKQSNLAQIPVIYGERKVGGTRVFVETSGTDNEYLYICFVLCEGEINGVTEIYINDHLSTTFTGGLSTHGASEAATGEYGGLIDFEVHHGKTGANQPYSTLLAETDSWGDADVADRTLSGVAYIAAKFKWDRDKFGSIPEIQAVVQGKKCAHWSNPTAYSYNPAVCLYDYLTNTTYGKGLTSSEFTTSVWDTAESLCDDNVPSYNGGADINVFECHAVLDTSKTLIDNVRVLLSSMQGLLVFEGGKYDLKIEKAGAKDGSNNLIVDYAFTQDNILSGITINSDKKRSKYNRVITTFPNPEKNWQSDQIEYPESGSSDYTTILAADNGFELKTTIALETVTSPYQARNIAYTALYRSRNSMQCSFVATIDALQVSVGDIVSVTHDSLGWYGKPFMVQGLTLNIDGNVAVTLVEYQEAPYTWMSGDGYSGSVVPTYADSNLPSPFSVSAVTESTIAVISSEAINDNGSSTQRLQVSWTNVTDSFISEYIVQITEDGTTNWDIEARAESSPVMISGIKSGTIYNVRIKAVTAAGISAGWVYLQDEASTTESACTTAGNTWDATLGICLIPITAANLTTAAGGGSTTYYQDTAPTGGDEGDLWFDTDDNKKLYRHDGTNWNTQVSGNLIGTTVSTGLSDIDPNLGTITGGSLSINNLFTVDSSGNCTIKNAATGARLEIKNDVIKVFDSSGTVRVQIGDLT